MPSKALDAFYQDIVVHLPECPEPLMDNAIRNAAIEFCQRTLAWNEAMDAESVAATDLPYQVVGWPSGSVVCDILAMSVGGKQVDQKNARTLDQRGDWRAETGAVEGYIQTAQDAFDLWPRPAEAVSVIVTAAFAPTKTADTLPDFLYHQYAEAIAAGALARLFVIPRQPWTDPAAGSGWGGLFNGAIGETRASVMRSFGAPVRVPYRGC